jgi:3-oxoacyl-[acyl-carrier-protein] synthase II
VTEIQIPSRFPARVLRRASRLTQLALGAVERAWQEGRLSNTLRVGLVAGTALADLDQTADFLRGLQQRGGRFASPQSFQRSVHSDLAGELAILYQLQGYNLTVTQGLSSGLTALFAATLALRSGRCDQCLCVAADTRCDALLDAAQARGAKADDLGEGAAALVLEREADALRRQARILAEIYELDLVRLQTQPAVRHSGGIYGAAGLVTLVQAIDGELGAEIPQGIRLIRRNTTRACP